METIIDKLSSYNIFNYLFPGVVFCLGFSYLTNITILPTDSLLNLFFYYFVGMVISRIGSLIIEKLLLKIKYVKYTNYKDFQIAEAVDQKLQTLLEIANMYRTIISMILLLLIFYCVFLILNYSSISGFRFCYNIIALLLLLVLFIISFKKQVLYITKRVENIQENQKGDSK